jgi:dTMP kinase
VTLKASKKVGNGAVIMFDGPDWVGKTTQVALTAKTLKESGLDTYVSRVNGGTPVGEALRQVMLNSDLSRPVETDLYIFMAMCSALAIDLDERRSKGTVCLIDRSPLSILAYQVYGSGLNKTEGLKATKLVFSLFKPELTICYFAPKKVLKAHQSKRQDSSLAYYKSQPASYMERVVAGYKAATEEFDATAIDASGGIDKVHELTMREIYSRCPGLKPTYSS